MSNLLGSARVGAWDTSGVTSCPTNLNSNSCVFDEIADCMDSKNFDFALLQVLLTGVTAAGSDSHCTILIKFKLESPGLTQDSNSDLVTKWSLGVARFGTFSGWTSKLRL